MSITTITSDTILSDIEHHFRVSAGPGAGKTYWLVGHIKNVLHKSERLAKTRKIACITYTNIAVDTILSRLGSASERVEVSTIHSFLYNHILKPYASLISADFELNVKEMDGHDDVVLSSYGFINEWKNLTKQQRIRKDHLIVAAFKAIQWKFDASGNLIANTRYPHKVDGYAIKKASFFEYKKMMWKRGIVHHDDVLFFSYQIIKKYPFVLDVLRAKFPYCFIDEFQDSNPIQVEIIKKLGITQTITGIIGDKAQSIYRFQGADPSQFTSFILPNIKDYVMKENRRSSNEIINILNAIRTDFIQHSYRNAEKMQPVILVGEMSAALRRAKNICGNETVYSLSRDNITSNAMKRELGCTTLNAKLMDDLKAADSNSPRANLVVACIKAVEFARENKFKDSVKELDRIFRDKNDLQKGRRISLTHLSTLLDKYDGYKNGSLLEFTQFLKREIRPDLTRVTSGAIKTFYESHAYQDLALCINVPEDLSQHKTIHKAKGDEFDNVLLVLKEEIDLEFLLNPDIDANTDAGEEQRINYVAVSRAKNRLFISVPTLHNRALLETKFQIENV